MKKPKFRSDVAWSNLVTAFFAAGVLIAVGSSAHAQEECSVREICRNIGSQDEDSPPSTEDFRNVEDSGNAFSGSSNNDTSGFDNFQQRRSQTGLSNKLSTLPPAEYRTPQSVWSPRESVAVEPDVAIKQYAWTAPGVVHRNLIFEEPLLERHGFHRGETYQPIISGAKFFWRATFLPFDVIKHHHKRCDSGLGWGAPSVDVCEDCPR